MGKFGGFFTGEKKKKKKGADRPISSAPVFTPPEVISKGKKVGE